MHVETRDDSSQADRDSVTIASPISPCSDTTITPLSKSTAPEQRALIRLASASAMFFVLGWGDGVTGTLLPYFKTDFHLSFMTSSLCFVASTIGFSLASICVERLLHAAGRIYLRSGKTTPPALSPRASHPDNIAYFSPSTARFIVVFCSTLLHPIFFVIMGLRKNFPSMLIAYLISSFARSLLSATMNYYVASVSKRGLGYMYGFWSIGSMCAPLVCQSIIAKGIEWNHFYFGSLVLSAISSALAFYAFFPTAHEHEAEVTAALSGSASPSTISVEGKAPPTSEVDEANIAEVKQSLARTKNEHVLGRSMKMAAVWAFSIFCCLYTGTEVSTQGFIVTFLLNVRNADPDVVGYAMSGFWGGLALSRFIWGFINDRFTFAQRKYFIQGCIPLFRLGRQAARVQVDRADPPVSTGFALGLQLIIWFVKSFTANACAIAIIGFAYGPVFPGNMGQAHEYLPAEVRMVAMAIIGAFGSFGAALFPFLTGTLTNYEGQMSYIYFIVAQTACIFCLWAFFPTSVPSRTK